jgi:hypothetical protein
VTCGASSLPGMASRSASSSAPSRTSRPTASASEPGTEGSRAVNPPGMTCSSGALSGPAGPSGTWCWI